MDIAFFYRTILVLISYKPFWPSGAITGAITTPLDVMKTRLMVQVTTSSSRLVLKYRNCIWMIHFICLGLQGSANQYKGLLNCAQTILREEGPAAFLKVWLFLIVFFCPYLFYPSRRFHFMLLSMMSVCRKRLISDLPCV